MPTEPRVAGAVADRVAVRRLGRTKDPAGLEQGRGYVSERSGARAVFCHNAEPMAFIAHLEFTPGLVRADHYHLRKKEFMAIVSGVVRAKFLLPEDPADVLEMTLEVGDVVSVAPGCVHSYRAEEKAAAVEYSPNLFQADDTFSHAIPW
ncbi:cupin domain-containing protein [Streptomyces sp. NPDC046939]|uniref:cupin domain-containing protein n=1 Tax=Streptomyces sp. NPDC046939 TaxID=3155376 RepID=UPI00340BABF4